MKPIIYRITRIYPNALPLLRKGRGSTVQIKAEADWPESGVLPSRFVSLQDYERLERAGHRVLILDDAEPGEVSEAHVAVIGELRAALSSEATKGEQAPPPPVRPPGVGITETGGRSK